VRITLVGCGALGGLFAARLLAAGEDVQMLQRPGKRLEDLRRKGLRFREASGERSVFFPPLASSPEELPPAPLVIVAVKAWSTSSVAPFMPGLLEKHGWVLTVQNGLGNAEILAEKVEERSIVLGPCTYGARLDSEGSVCAAGEGELLLGPFRKERDLAPLQALFEHAGFRTILREDPLPLLWEKLILNAAINPLSALARCSNGDLLASEDLRKIMEKLVWEALQVARGEGVALDHQECLEKCFSVCRKTGSNRNSMLQDVEAKRPTENDAISGQVVLRGRRRGIPVPCTEDIWHLLRGVDALAANRKRSSACEKTPKKDYPKPLSTPEQ